MNEDRRLQTTAALCGSAAKDRVTDGAYRTMGRMASRVVGVSVFGGRKDSCRMVSDDAAPTELGVLFLGCSTEMSHLTALGGGPLAAAGDDAEPGYAADNC